MPKTNVKQSRTAGKLKNLQREVVRLRKELRDSEWASRKTNEGIKALYKELEKKNEELKKLDQLKSDFVSTVSHELRTPLSITKESVGLVVDEIPGKINKKQGQILAAAMKNIDRLAQIINDLLDISKIEAGRVKLSRGPVDITGLIRQVVSSLGSQAQKKGLQLRVALPREGITAYGDTHKISEVFTNLVTNGLKFTEKGYIEISAQEKNGAVECSVADTGIGISKNNLPNVFSKFQQFSRVAGAGGKGTGLGLSIAKGIIDMHRGKIWVESELGKGTKFTFILPKYIPKLSFRKYIEDRIKEIMESNAKMSIIVISVTGFNKLEQEISAEKIDSTLNDMRDILEDSLRLEKDIIIKKIGEIIVILADCNKKGALSVEGRLRQILQGYLIREKMIRQINLRLGHAAYPDEAGSVEELLKKARGS